MIEAKDGEVTFRGIKSHFYVRLKETVSEEEYKTVIRLADKSEEQVKDETERARETLKKLLGL